MVMRVPIHSGTSAESNGTPKPTARPRMMIQGKMVNGPTASEMLLAREAASGYPSPSPSAMAGQVPSARDVPAETGKPRPMDLQIRPKAVRPHEAGGRAGVWLVAVLVDGRALSGHARTALLLG